MKKILFKILLAVAGKFLAKRFGYGKYSGYQSTGYGYDPYFGSRNYDASYRGGFFKPYKYKRKKSKLKKLIDFFD